jgi:hypothetical protein
MGSEEERQRVMKLRHNATLGLLGWCLGVTLGKTVDKGGSNCGFPLEIEAESCVEKFKTETECRFGGYKYVQDYYVKADKGGGLVVVPPVTNCYENAPDDLHLKEK